MAEGGELNIARGFDPGYPETFGSQSLYCCKKCGLAYSFKLAYEARGEICQLDGRRRFRCVNPSCDGNWIEEKAPAELGD